MSDQTFSTEDTALYTSWQRENGGIVVIHIPGVGELKMTLGKAEDISKDLARQVEYGRWYDMEARHIESQKKDKGGTYS